MRALRFFELGEVGRAIDVATTAVEIAPGEAQSWAYLGSLHSVAGDAAEARTSFARCAHHATGAVMDECTSRVE